MRTLLSDASQKRSAATRGGSWLAFAFIFASPALAVDKSPSDAEHLLYLADSGLAVIRLTIDIDGESHRELCRACVQAICIEADRNQDKFLTAAEYDARIANHPILQERQARMIQRPNATPPRPDFSGEKVPVGAVANFLLRRLWSPLVLEFNSRSMGRISATGELMDRPIADTRLFERLDGDGNRKLTARELEKAVDLLEKLDFDGDETLSLDELRMQAGSATTNMMNQSARQSDGQLSLLSPDRIDAQFVRRILTRYDGEADGSVKDLRLDRMELGLAEKLFSQADADEDGYWDFDELRRFLEHPLPTIEIAMHLVAGVPTTAEFASHDSTAAKLLDQQAGVVGFEIHGTRIQLLLPQGEPLNRGSDATWKIEFQSLDDDKNEYLEASEYPFGAEGDEASPIFKQMDADASGKVYLDEYLAYYHKSQRARASQLVINAENLERTLFGPLDANADGRLSQRELGQLNPRLKEWDADGDGKLVEAEIPQQYRLTMSRGEDRVAFFRSPIYVDESTTPAAASSAGPVWFRKMDRNRDGEVSSREFLGPAARFEKIDANSDGAIDAGEAAAVK